MQWVLILFIHSGMMSKYDSVAITSLRFNGQAACEESGKKISNLTVGTLQSAKWVCVKD